MALRVPFIACPFRVYIVSVTEFMCILCVLCKNMIDPNKDYNNKTW